MLIKAPYISWQKPDFFYSCEIHKPTETIPCTDNTDKENPPGLEFRKGTLTLASRMAVTTALGLRSPKKKLQNQS